MLSRCCELRAGLVLRRPVIESGTRQKNSVVYLLPITQYIPSILVLELIKRLMLPHCSNSGCICGVGVITQALLPHCFSRGKW